MTNPADAGEDVVIRGDRFCRSCRFVRDILCEGLALSLTGPAPEWRNWHDGWWCEKHQRRTEELGFCEQHGFGKADGPVVVTRNP